MQEEQNSKMREHMLDYLVSLIDDATDFSWGVANASHAVLLCRMEQGEIQDYSQIEKIDRIRRANAQKHVQPAGPKNAQNNNKSFTKISKSMPCLYYNQNSCTHQKTHETKGVSYKHVCSSCFATSGKRFAHPESECRNKKRVNKGMVTGQNHTLQKRMVFWSSVRNSEGFLPKPNVWQKWLHTANAFNNKCNGRSYALVVVGNQIPKCHTSKKIVGQTIQKISPEQ